MNPHAAHCALSRRALGRRRACCPLAGAAGAAPARGRSADRAPDPSVVMVLTSVSAWVTCCRGLLVAGIACCPGYLLMAAAAADCAACRAAAGVAAPLSAFCTAVHSCWEISGYLVPRLSPVRALATP